MPYTGRADSLRRAPELTYAGSLTSPVYTTAFCKWEYPA